MLDGQTPPDGVVEGVGYGNGNPSAVLHQHLLMPRSIGINVHDRVVMGVLKLLTYFNNLSFSYHSRVALNIFRIFSGE